jgi:hypothetical protein
MLLQELLLLFVAAAPMQIKFDCLRTPLFTLTSRCLTVFWIWHELGELLMMKASSGKKTIMRKKKLVG